MYSLNHAKYWPLKYQLEESLTFIKGNVIAGLHWNGPLSGVMKSRLGTFFKARAKSPNGGLDIDHI